MPKSKRNQIVHLTQVKKKGKDHKEDLMKQIEQFVAQYQRVFIFNFDNTKSDRIMLLRVRLKEFGRIFAGRNSLVTATLRKISGKNKINYDDLAKQVAGHRGLLFTDLKLDQLIDVLDKNLPEFREKLLGYAQIAPNVGQMDVDEDNSEKSDTDKVNLKKKSKAKKVPVQSEKISNVESNKTLEVKFIMI